MAVTLKQLDDMVKAWGSGATRVSVEGKSVEYRSLDELARQIAAASRALGVANPLAPAAGRVRKRQIRIRTTSGF